MKETNHPTDLTDSQWDWSKKHLPLQPPRRGRPREDLRAVLNAIFYLQKIGCQCRLLPRETVGIHGEVAHKIPAALKCSPNGGSLGARVRGSATSVVSSKVKSGVPIPPKR
ncbi:transposase [Rubinisphaera brasiliensis]|uniref:transposase n=1 Tax=Rubinisphaera brasiliensis TaxID=119 RepID=UPI001FDEE2E0|nr:transposase [Rubinisphaera brasiliensis]